MNADPIDRVFGRGRLRMVTGAQVEVFREAAAPGESRRYTKRFLATPEGDYGEWTEREWRILARLIGHGARCVPDVVQFDREARGPMMVQTYDAGATVDQWATLLPVERDGHVRAHVFQDCAHWWALAHHCLVALQEIHAIGLVHLDVKADNVCIPVGPEGFDPAAPAMRLAPRFDRLALIDFAFSLASGETLTTPLPIGWQRDYDYQSPRLLHALEAGRAGDLRPTEQLDWRCDFYSLAAMLKRYLPDDHRLHDPDAACGWTSQRYHAAKALILALREAHDAPVAAERPHARLVAVAAAHFEDEALADSLRVGWRLARDAVPAEAPSVPLTPLTRIAPPLRTVVRSDDDETMPAVFVTARAAPLHARPPRGPRWSVALLVGGAALFAFAATQLVTGGTALDAGPAQRLVERLRPRVAPSAPPVAAAPADTADAAEATAGAAPASAPVTETAPAPEAPLPEGPAPAAPVRADDRPVTTPAAVVDAPSSVDRKPVAPPSRATVARAKPPVPRPPAPRAASARPPVPAKTVVATVSPRPPKVAAAPPPRAAPSRPPAVTAPAVAPAPASGPARVPAAPRVEEPRVAMADAPSGAVTSPARTPVMPQGTPVGPAVDRPATAVPPTPSTSAPRPAVTTPSPLTVVAGGPGRAPIIDLSRSRDAVPAPMPSVPVPAPAQEVAPQPASSPPPPVAEPRGPAAARHVARDDDAYLEQGQRALASLVPKTAAQARIQIAPVLRSAADAHHPSYDRTVVALASAPGALDAAFVDPAVAPRDARRFHDDARRAYWSRRDVREVLDLELKAFGANPNDAEIAGHLAFLHLHTRPMQADRARLLALHALGLRSPAFPAGRPDDWITFAVASALTSRPIDATQGLYAAVAVASDPEHVCQAALAALEAHGERLREPVDALLARLQAQGRTDGSRACVRRPQRLVEWRYR